MPSNVSKESFVKRHYVRIFKLRLELFPIAMPSCVRLVNLINENITKIEPEKSELLMQFESVLTCENCASSANQFQKFDIVYQSLNVVLTTSQTKTYLYFLKYSF